MPVRAEWRYAWAVLSAAACALLVFLTAPSAASEVVPHVCETNIVRTLANADPSTTDGALRVTVDGLGAFGSATAAGDAVFNPVGPAGAGGTTFTSNLYLSSAGRLLADDDSVPVCVIAESPLRTQATLGSVQIEVTQELAPVAEGGSTLTQT
jgi:hypothetical protein